MKKIFKSRIFLIIMTSIITASIVGVSATVLYSARDIGFTPTNSNWNVNNLEDALNYLYTNGGGAGGNSYYNLDITLYVDGTLNNNALQEYNGLYMDSYSCQNGTELVYDIPSEIITAKNLSHDDTCSVYFLNLSFGSDKINLNIDNRKSYSADSYDDTNVPLNAIDDSMINGNGKNWYGGTKLLIEYDTPSYIEDIGVYTTNNWGYAFSNATIYYSLNDDLTLTSDLTQFDSVTVSTEADRTLSEPITAKRVLLIKNSNQAVYEFKCLGYKST